MNLAALKRLSLAVLALPLVAVLPAHADEWSKTYTISGKPDLRIETSDANIRVTTWDQNTIEAKVDTSRYKIGEGGIRVEEHQNGDTVEIEVRYPHHNFNVEWGSHRVRNHYPDAARGPASTCAPATARSISPDFKGDMDLHSGDGSENLESVDGKLHATTGDGHITAQRPLRRTRAQDRRWTRRRRAARLLAGRRLAARNRRRQRLPRSSQRLSADVEPAHQRRPHRSRHARRHRRQDSPERSSRQAQRRRQPADHPHRRWFDSSAERLKPLGVSGVSPESFRVIRIDRLGLYFGVSRFSISCRTRFSCMAISAHECIFVRVLLRRLLSHCPATGGNKLRPRRSTSPRWTATSIPAWISSPIPAADGSRTIPSLPTSPRGTPIPKCRTRIWSQLRSILEAAAAPDPKRNAVDQKIGDYYASCTDEKAIDAKGADPLKPSLEQIAKINSKAELADVAAAMIDDNVLFRFDSIQDPHAANQVIANADQGGLGLPDRDYYLRTIPKSGICAKHISRTCRKCLSCSATSLKRPRRSANRHAHRNCAGKGFDDPRRAARSQSS